MKPAVHSRVFLIFLIPEWRAVPCGSFVNCWLETESKRSRD